MISAAKVTEERVLGFCCVANVGFRLLLFLPEIEAMLGSAELRTRFSRAYKIQLQFVKTFGFNKTSH